MNRPSFVLSLLIVLANTNSEAAKVEHWTCQMQIGTVKYTQDWIVSENKFFSTNAQSSLPLIYNTDQVAVAYSAPQKKGSPVVSWVYVLDKKAGKIVTYNDLTAAVAAGAYGEIEPDAKVSPCARAKD